MMDEQLRDNVAQLLTSRAEEPSAQFVGRLEQAHGARPRAESAGRWAMSLVAAGLLAGILAWLVGPLGTKGDASLASPQDDKETWQEIRSIREYWGPVMCAKGTKNGGVISVGKDKLVRVWDSNGKLIRDFRGHQDWVTHLAITKDERIAISIGRDGQAVIWNVSTGEAMRTIRPSINPANTPISCAIHPSGQRVAVGLRDGNMLEFSVDTGEEIWKERVVDRLVKAVAYSPDGKFLAGTGFEVIKMYNVETGKLEKTFSKHDRVEVNSIAFSNNGNWLVSAASDGLVKVWNVKSGMSNRMLSGHKGPVLSVSIDPQDRLIASGGSDAVIYLWELPGGGQKAKLEGHNISAQHVSFGPDGRSLVSTSLDSTIRVWSIPDGREVRKWQGHGGHIFSVMYNHGGNYLAAAGLEYSVKIWETGGWKLQKELAKGWDDIIYSLAYNPARDGEIAAGYQDGVLKIWDAGNEELLLEGMAHGGRISALAYCNGGKYLMSGGQDASIIVWDAMARKIVKKLGHDGAISAITGHPKDPVFVSADQGGLVFHWRIDPKKTEWVQKPVGDFATAVVGLMFNKDGSKLLMASVDGNMGIVDMKPTTPKPIEQMQFGHPVFAAVIDGEGKRYAAAGANRSVRVYTVGTRQYQELTGFADSVTSLAFNPDGDELAVATQDGEIKIFKLGRKK